MYSLIKSKVMKEADYIVKVKDFLKFSKKEVKKYKRLSAKYYRDEDNVKKFWLAWILSHGSICFNNNGTVSVSSPKIKQDGWSGEGEFDYCNFYDCESVFEAIKTAVEKVASNFEDGSEIYDDTDD